MNCFVAYTDAALAERIADLLQDARLQVLIWREGARTCNLLMSICSDISHATIA